MNAPFPLQTIPAIMAPELILAIGGLALLMYAVFMGDKATRSTSILTGIVLMGACGFCFYNGFGFDLQKFLSPTDLGSANYAFGRTFIDDGYSRFLKICILLASAGSVVLSLTFLRQQNVERSEYPVLILFATLGMLFMVSANDLLVLYMGLELQSLALYVLASFQRKKALSSEAGLKYFVLGALSSGLLLYGISLVYGVTGATGFDTIAEKLAAAPTAPLGAVIGMVFIVAGLAFKISAVPFHMWTPDVFEGAPSPVVGFFGTAPKLAAIGLLGRLLEQPFVSLHPQWQLIVLIMAVTSLILGSFAGIVQDNIKRLMGYSSIANLGTALIALGVGGEEGIQSMLIYLVIYFVNTLGVFGVILCLRHEGRMVERISDMAGLSRTHPRLALIMVIFMFSLAGIPPLAGFFAKYFVFLAAVQAGMVPLAVLGVMVSAVAAYYCLRVLKVMYFDDDLGGKEIDHAPEFFLRIVPAGAALLIVCFWFYPAPVVSGALAAARSILTP